MTPEKLIDIYLDQLMSTDTHAGWHQPGMLQRMVEFRGDIPPPTGFDQADLKMIHEVVWLKRPHALYPLARKLLHTMPDLEYLAVVADRYYEQRVDAKGRRMTEPKIAEEVDLSLGKYRHAKQQGYFRLNAQLDLVKLIAV